ncbi:MAG: hypothetical protein OHK0013_05610 [Sandaracinaceae bacterium]
MKRTPLLASAALLVGGLVVMYLYQEQFRIERSGGPSVEVVIAAQDIAFGEPVRAEWLSTKLLPRDYVEDRHILGNRIRDLIGLPLAQSVRAGEAIMRTDLSPLSDQQRTLSGEIPSGSRAITIMATPTSSFNGLLRPGDHVDVVLTIGDPLRHEGWHNVLLLENVAVLAVGRQIHEEEMDDGRRAFRPGQTTSVTLQVTIEEGALITQAQQDGRIQLMLRNGNDLSERGTRHELQMADISDPLRRARFLARGPRRPPSIDSAAVSPAAASGAVQPARP